MAHNVFVTGAGGYIGRHLMPELLRRGHVVCALVRKGSELHPVKHSSVVRAIADAVQKPA